MLNKPIKTLGEINMDHITYHPKEKENRSSLVWLFLIILAITYVAVHLPFAIAFNLKSTDLSVTIDIIISLIMGIDYTLRWKQKLKLPEYIGIKNNYETPLIFKNSIWKYLDIFACIPFELITFGYDIPARNSVALVLLALQALRLAKIRSLWTLAGFFPKYGKLAFLSFNIALAIHWIACGWILLTPNLNLMYLEEYSLALYWAITTLTTVGYGDITPQTIGARFYTMAIMLIGVGVYGVIIGQISRLMMLQDRYTQEKNDKLSHLGQYMKHYQIPSNLQKEVYSYYGHILNNSIAKQDDDILRDLPTSLQNELEIYAKIKLIKNIDIFKDCSLPCLKMIAQKLKQNCYNPQDVIITEGQNGDQMYVIAHGEVQVLVAGKILKTLRSGQFFGEMALIEDAVRKATIQSRTYCDLYSFCKEDFLKVIASYPVMKKRFYDIYEKRKEQNHQKVA